MIREVKFLSSLNTCGYPICVVTVIEEIVTDGGGVSVTSTETESPTTGKYVSSFLH